MTNQEILYISPKDIKDIDFKSAVYPCTCPWYLHWIPFYKKKYASFRMCPVTKLEMDMEIIKISLELFPTHVDRKKMADHLNETLEKLKVTKCTCEE